jgi:hypothetical protein
VPIPFFNILQSTLGEKARESLTNMEQGRWWQKPLFSLTVVIRGYIGWLQQKYGVFNTCRFPDLTDLWVQPAFRAVAAEQWDLVVSTAWPYTVHRVASRLHKQEIAKKWIADWRDLWIENHLFPGIWPFTQLEKKWERSWAYQADAMTAVSEPQATVLKDKYGCDVTTIYNGFDPDDYEQLPMARAYPTDAVFRMVFTGSYYPSRQDPTPFFKALQQLHQSGEICPDTFQVLFYGYNSNLAPLANSHQVSDYIQYGGFLHRDQVLHYQRDADALLFLDFASDSVPGILSGKLYEYLYAGPPILSVGRSLDGSVSKILEKTDRGKAFGDDIAAIATGISNLLETKRKGASPYFGKKEAFLDVVNQYSRQRQAYRLLALGLTMIEKG